MSIYFVNFYSKRYYSYSLEQNLFIFDRNHKINETLSDPIELETGFPQGSGWGPQAYSKYVGPLGELLRLLQVLYHLFADDTQLLQSLNPNSVDSQVLALQYMENAISEVSKWMTQNKLKLNESKTEFIIFGTGKQMQKMQQNAISIGGELIEAKPCVRNLGAYFDSELKMETHVNNILKVGYFHLRQIRTIRKYLTDFATKCLVHATIMSRIDYANALLYNIPEVLIDKLQRLQNCAARLITGDTRSVNSMLVLKKLHWLPIRARIRYKIVLLTFKSLKGLAPSYLREMLEVRVSCRDTRLSNSGLRLVEPRSKLRFGGDRAFSVSAPRLWNALPRHMRDIMQLDLFKRQLKTLLFSESFS